MCLWQTLLQKTNSNQMFVARLISDISTPVDLLNEKRSHSQCTTGVSYFLSQLDQRDEKTPVFADWIQPTCLLCPHCPCPVKHSTEREMVQEMEEAGDCIGDLERCCCKLLGRPLDKKELSYRNMFAQKMDENGWKNNVHFVTGLCLHYLVLYFR